jgi:hypothetical protein
MAHNEPRAAAGARGDVLPDEVAAIEKIDDPT